METMEKETDMPSLSLEHSSVTIDRPEAEKLWARSRVYYENMGNTTTYEVMATPFFFWQT